MMKNLSRKTPSFSFENLAKYLFLFLKRSLVQNYIALLYRLSAISNIQYPSSHWSYGVILDDSDSCCFMTCTSNRDFILHFWITTF